MNEKVLMRVLKIVIVFGLCLIGLGYYLINVVNLPAKEASGISSAVADERTANDTLAENSPANFS